MAAQRLVEAQPDVPRMVGLSGRHVTRTVAPPHIAVQRELGDGQHLAAHVEYRAVHPALVVIEDPQIGDLAGRPIDLLGPVVIADRNQQHQSGADSLRLEGGVRFAGRRVDHVHTG